MNRAAILTVNSALFVLCCFLAARVVAAVAGAWLAPVEVEIEAPTPSGAIPERSWSDRQVILSRNLFNVSTLAPRDSTPEPESLAKTRLPLKLLGTVASDDPEVARAAVEDLDSRTHLVVRIGDRLKDRAEVLRIERRRIVLENAGRREELALEDGEPEAARPAPRRTAARARSARQPRSARATPPDAAATARRLIEESGLKSADQNELIEQLAENRFAVPRENLDSVANNPAALFSQARILPKYEDGQMVGVQLNAIKPGSIFEQIGIQDGDTITEFNGIQVTGPQQNAEVMRELASSTAFQVTVTGRDGEQRQLEYEIR